MGRLVLDGTYLSCFLEGSVANTWRDSRMRSRLLALLAFGAFLLPALAQAQAPYPWLKTERVTWRRQSLGTDNFVANLDSAVTTRVSSARAETTAAISLQAWSPWPWASTSAATDTCLALVFGLGPTASSNYKLGQAHTGTSPTVTLQTSLNGLDWTTTGLTTGGTELGTSDETVYGFFISRAVGQFGANLTVWPYFFVRLVTSSWTRLGEYEGVIKYYTTAYPGGP